MISIFWSSKRKREKEMKKKNVHIAIEAGNQDGRKNSWPKSGLGRVYRKSRRLFGPEKPVIKLRLAYSVKLVFSYVVKGIKI